MRHNFLDSCREYFFGALLVHRLPLSRGCVIFPARYLSKLHVQKEKVFSLLITFKEVASFLVLYPDAQAEGLAWIINAEKLRALKAGHEVLSHERLDFLVH